MSSLCHLTSVSQPERERGQIGSDRLTPEEARLLETRYLCDVVHNVCPVTDFPH